MKTPPAIHRTPSYDAAMSEWCEFRLSEVEDKLPPEDTYHLKARSRYRKEFAETIYDEKKHNGRLTRIFRGTTNDDKLLYKKIENWIAEGPESERADRKKIGEALTANVTDRYHWINVSFDKCKFMPPDFLKEFTWLKSLGICGGDFDRLPDLPCSLKTLRIDWCPNLSELPRLPIGLETLVVAYSGLEKLPMLPPWLGVLDVKDNKLRELPEDPGTLREVNVWRNRLSSLPNFNSGVSLLIISDNQFVDVPQTVIDKKNRYVKWAFAGNHWSDKAEKFITQKFTTMSTPD